MLRHNNGPLADQLPTLRGSSILSGAILRIMEVSDTFSKYIAVGAMMAMMAASPVAEGSTWRTTGPLGERSYEKICFMHIRKTGKEWKT